MTTCSYPDCENKPERSGKCATHARMERKDIEKVQKAEQKKAAKKPVKKVSDKMAEALKVYAVQRRDFLKANPICEVFKDRPATEVHHQRGRNTIDLLLDSNYWLAVSREAHQKIELNPDWAKEMGYSLSRLAKETPTI